MKPPSAEMFTTMSSELTEQVLRIKKGDHLCLFYDKDPAEQLPALVPFIQAALAGNEQFVYIADDQTSDELNQRLRDSGIDVDEAVQRTGSSFWTRKEWRQPGEPSSQKKLQQVRR
ncbi:MAG: MEDS domain-containing protein [Verrucomicrobiota bacterium]